MTPRARTEWCVRQDYGFAAGCVWVLAHDADEARRRGEPVLRNSFQTAKPVGPLETFRRAEYQDRAGARDFTAGFAR